MHKHVRKSSLFKVLLSVNIIITIVYPIYKTLSNPPSDYIANGLTSYLFIGGSVSLLFFIVSLLTLIFKRSELKIKALYVNGVLTLVMMLCTIVTLRELNPYRPYELCKKFELEGVHYSIRLENNNEHTFSIMKESKPKYWIFDSYGTWEKDQISGYKLLSQDSNKNSIYVRRGYIVHSEEAVELF